MRAYDACWTDLWCRIMSTLHLPLASAAGARLGSGSIFRLSWVSDAKKPVLTAFPPAAFRQPWHFISHWKWLMDMQITEAWAHIQIWETAIRRRQNEKQYNSVFDITSLSLIAVWSRQACYLPLSLRPSFCPSDILYILSVLFPAAQGPIEVKSLSRGSYGVRCLSFSSLQPVIATFFSSVLPLI